MESEFGAAIIAGLSGRVKRIPSRYHYDEKGSKIFQEIMGLPEYYPARCELQILSKYGPTILTLLNFKRNFNVVELGCGDGLKTLQLLKSFTEAQAEFTFVPVDISKDAVEALERRMRSAFPLIPIQSVVGDFFSVMEELRLQDAQSVYLFLGLSIGNFTQEECTDFLSQIWKRMAPGDKILIGFDLRKNPEIISSAYNDSQGVTKSFNMNRLERIRTELEADVKLENFDFCSQYNLSNGENRIHLISLLPETFTSQVLDKSFFFEAGDKILTEISKKFTTEEIGALATFHGFKILHNLMDEQNYCTISIWEKKTQDRKKSSSGGPWE